MIFCQFLMLQTSAETTREAPTGLPLRQQLFPLHLISIMLWEIDILRAAVETMSKCRSPMLRNCSIIMMMESRIMLVVSLTTSMYSSRTEIKIQRRRDKDLSQWDLREKMMKLMKRRRMLSSMIHHSMQLQVRDLISDLKMKQMWEDL